jgi:enoyl-CoA hydratase
MSYETLLVETEGRICTITFNRPAVLNALNIKLVGELGEALEAARRDPEVGVVVLTGAGDKAFAAGADIAELAKLDSMGAVELARRGQGVTRAMEKLGKPVIAAVNGFALGGGCEIAMACTLRVAADTARLGQPEVNLGIIPGYGGTQRLARLVGKGRALDLVLTGRMVGAAEAKEMGLVNQVVPAAELQGAVRKLAATLLEKGPLALRMTMEAVHTGFDLGLDEALELEAHLFGLSAATEDMKEGLGAFLEKRKAAFRGK